MLTVKCSFCQGRGYTECECAREAAPDISSAGERKAEAEPAQGGNNPGEKKGDPACEVCGGSGRKLCLGCMGGGLVDMPAFG
ncbi:hypothetical protein IJT93_11480 [bacterium]|nr:hypothetical protein [bacterium]